MHRGRTGTSPGRIVASPWAVRGVEAVVEADPDPRHTVVGGETWLPEAGHGVAGALQEAFPPLTIAVKTEDGVSLPTEVRCAPRSCLIGSTWCQ